MTGYKVGNRERDRRGQQPHQDNLNERISETLHLAGFGYPGIYRVLSGIDRTVPLSPPPDTKLGPLLTQCVAPLSKQAYQTPGLVRRGESATKFSLPMRRGESTPPLNRMGLGPHHTSLVDQYYTALSRSFPIATPFTSTASKMSQIETGDRNRPEKSR